MRELTSIAEMRAWSRTERSRRHTIGFVPTMGFLHEGHLRLVDRARELAERVVVSIFVNPLQFGPTEDLARYPRDLPRDRQLAEGREVDCLFVPEAAAMYTGEPLVRVIPGAVADTLEGAARPGHFIGVLTVVAKLFHIVEPDVAVFGRKDFQQAMLVKRLVQDLDFPVTIDVAPTVRELDGLALSSRNTYLSPDERRAAFQLQLRHHHQDELPLQRHRDAFQLPRLPACHPGLELCRRTYSPSVCSRREHSPDVAHCAANYLVPGG